MKDRIDKIFDLLDENGKTLDKIDISTLNDMIVDFLQERKEKPISTVTLLERELRWLRSEMLNKNIQTVYK